MSVATALRKRQTSSEIFLWSQLRNRRFHGYKFRRQHPIKRYVVDFVCLERKLIIELDGKTHSIKIDADNRRDAALKEEGFMTLRIKNPDLLNAYPLCVQKILASLEREIP